MDLQTKALFSSYGYFDLQGRLLLSLQNLVEDHLSAQTFYSSVSLATKRLLFISYKNQKRAAKYS